MTEIVEIKRFDQEQYDSVVNELNRLENKIDKEKLEEDRSERTPRRWNLIIGAVNEGDDPRTFKPPFNEYEMYEFLRMKKQKIEFDKEQLENYEKGLTERPCPLIFECAELDW